MSDQLSTWSRKTWWHSEVTPYVLSRNTQLLFMFKKHTNRYDEKIQDLLYLVMMSDYQQWSSTWGIRVLPTKQLCLQQIKFIYVSMYISACKFDCGENKSLSELEGNRCKRVASGASFTRSTLITWLRAKLKYLQDAQCEPYTSRKMVKKVWYLCSESVILSDVM